MASRAKRKRMDRGQEWPPHLKGYSQGPWPDFVANATASRVVCPDCCEPIIDSVCACQMQSHFSRASVIVQEYNRT